MKDVFNFCAGPAALPRPVMRKAQQEWLDWQGTGVSIMELGHRTERFQALAHQSEQNLRQLLNISDDFEVLFLHGGATHQFGMIPQNLLPANSKATYAVSGIWSKKARDEAARLGSIASVDALIDSDDGKAILPQGQWPESGIADSAYLYYTPNETIGGVQYSFVPEAKVPLVADMSSCLLSAPVDMTRHDLIFACAQKNIGPAGLTLVIIRKSLLEQCQSEGLPSLSQYPLLAKHGSMYNTPPTFAWYLAGLVFDWLLEQGGLNLVAEKNRRKADLLYNCIDHNDFYANPVAPESRSLMNVPFTLADEALNQRFLDDARDAGLVALEGHRSVGGMRASIYNAMPEEGVQRLVAFMEDFSRRHG